MLLPRLARDVEELRSAYKVQVVEEADFINVVVESFPTGEGYNLASTTLLLRVPRAFPDAGLDMFWTDPSLTLANGSIPQAAESVETYSGRQWRRFSWHSSGWAPASQSLPAYLEFVRRRFRAA
jgi:hypothetical protein